MYRQSLFLSHFRKQTHLYAQPLSQFNRKSKPLALGLVSSLGIPQVPGVRSLNGRTQLLQTETKRIITRHAHSFRFPPPTLSSPLSLSSTTKSSPILKKSGTRSEEQKKMPPQATKAKAWMTYMMGKANQRMRKTMTR